MRFRGWANRKRTGSALQIIHQNLGLFAETFHGILNRSQPNLSICEVTISFVQTQLTARCKDSPPANHSFWLMVTASAQKAQGRGKAAMQKVSAGADVEWTSSDFPLPHLKVARKNKCSAKGETQIALSLAPFFLAQPSGPWWSVTYNMQVAPPGILLFQALKPVVPSGSFWALCVSICFATPTGLAGPTKTWEAGGSSRKELTS